ncbi:N-acetylglucosamine-specific PTS transporter subunit IIBC [Testudinibacter aquarius]|uniref:PTS glucose transporter subunit IIBC n=1 Tax=Testudinibacter aquarius TaxID=1524974 RepID=A0A4R3Y2V2_9PAST|nr:N-acetylglucosamine-specific PTS transporter subunit IIBC [Testudinibacter aquarius]KAE9528049.1 PTS glucose transporter subunit IIBC [Testudinibacter aquarius]TCV86505.1 PTS system N-acetylglucosamine-specific IIC component [Testudinibacter aquarius]TNG92646.1 PTS glucose transporter subunit IIBC [Testudinibacter aquarius]
MSILNYLQRIGRALMVPVAALPAAAILMGVGYWLDPNGWGADSQLAALLIKSGAAIIDNMSLLFAVGVAFGMSEDKHGSAALSGLVGFLVVTTLLSPGAVAQLEGIALDQVPAAFGKINNQFVGILVGAISAALYNRYYKVQLPPALAFFSGKRLVPIVVSVAAIILSFILLYVWPIIFGGLVSFGDSIKDMGAVGAGIYGFFNRLLIPIGLHHALNSVFWFDVAGINDIPNFIGGAQSLAEGKAVLGVTGMYQAGFFPIMMFGLPGAALAIYHMAKPENKAKVASLMIAAALASFFTGITEPLEFSFMFVAPVLYVIHALLTGISVFFAASMQWIAGFGFSAGLVDMVLSSQNPLAQNWYMLILQGLVFSVIYYVLFTAAIKIFRLETPGREAMQEDEPSAAPVTQNIGRREKAQQFVAALGGKDNISSIDACITRLRLVLRDLSKINETQLKALGSKGNVKLGDNALQVILGPEAEIIADEMKTL